MREQQIEELYKKAMENPKDLGLQEFVVKIVNDHTNKYLFLAQGWINKRRLLMEKINEHNETNNSKK